MAILQSLQDGQRPRLAARCDQARLHDPAAHRDQPYDALIGGVRHRVSYEPAESASGLFGGSSNWRGPIWFPVNYLLIESLQKFHHYYGDDLRVECPTGSGHMMTLWEVAGELSARLTRLFLRGPDGRRPADGP